MNMPLCIAFPTSAFASSASWAGSAVDTMATSTGKPWLPGSEGGTSWITRMPGICADFAETSTRISWMPRSRWSNGFVIRPAKPPLGKMTSNDETCSGNER